MTEDWQADRFPYRPQDSQRSQVRALPEPGECVGHRQRATIGQIIGGLSGSQILFVDWLDSGVEICSLEQWAKHLRQGTVYVLPTPTGPPLGSGGVNQQGGQVASFVNATGRSQEESGYVQFQQSGQQFQQRQDSYA